MPRIPSHDTLESSRSFLTLYTFRGSNWDSMEFLHIFNDWKTWLDSRVSLAIITTIAMAYSLIKLVTSYTRRGSSSVSSVNAKIVRAHGEWTPVAFSYPEVTPYPTDPMKLDPIPYRPFRYGEYHVTMGIRSMKWDEWIEVDSQYEKYHQIREHRVRTRGTSVIKVLPDNPGIVRSAADAAIETVHEIAEYLSRRFPSMFTIERHAASAENLHRGWDGLPPITTIRIVPLDLAYVLPLDVNDGENAASRALEIAANLVQEDLALMVEGTDGRYYFQAGAILVPGFWRIQDKIGLPLDEIHNTGNVPRYKEKLQLSMERFFKRLPVDKPVARNNYFFQIVKSSADSVGDIDPEELGWSDTSHGPEDSFNGAHISYEPNRPMPTPDTIRVRSERQTLRRLPRTGAILFTIRTYLTGIDKLGKEPESARRLAAALRGWGEDIGVYKGKPTGGWWDVTLDHLDKVSSDGALSEQTVKVTDNYPF